MKEDEKKFFIDLWKLKENIIRFHNYTFKNSDSKRFMYILEKWSRKGFWDYGVSLRGGWFIEENIPQQYLALLGGM